MNRTPPARRRRTRPTSSYALEGAGWTDAVRAGLESLIRGGSGKGLPVVFDFDNTLVCGDIGEATLAVLVNSGVLDPTALPETFFPAFKRPDGGVVTRAGCADLAEYYEALLAPTVHGSDDPSPHANGYALAVEVMTGLTPCDVVDATRQAYRMARVGEVRSIEVTPGRTAYPAPYFYPEMVELLARLLQHQFDVWIVSASNVWSVRWMIRHALPPLLRRYSVRRTIPPDRVVGISMLLSDRQQQLFKDPLLVRSLPSYAALEKAALRRFRLTSRFHFPVSTYSGKIACIMDQIGQPPYLCAGDSPGDVPMMKFSQNRLWVARLEKPDYQRSAISAIRETQPSRWLVQPALTKKSPGLVPNAGDLKVRLTLAPASVKASLALWRRPRLPRPWDVD